MNWITNKILSFMIRHKAISDNRDVVSFYRYGVEITISSFLNILLVLFIGILLFHFSWAVAFLITFVFIRLTVGGYHADTYLRCNLIMCSVFLMVAFLSNLLTFKHISIPIFIIIFTSSMIIMFGPVDNPNKPVPADKRLYYKIISLVKSSIAGIVSMVLIINNNVIGTVISFTLLFIAILIIAAKIKEKKCKHGFTCNIDPTLNQEYGN